MACLGRRGTHMPSRPGCKSTLLLAVSSILKFILSLDPPLAAPAMPPKAGFLKPIYQDGLKINPGTVHPARH